jgi:hypothetical protein
MLLVWWKKVQDPRQKTSKHMVDFKAFIKHLVRPQPFFPSGISTQAHQLQEETSEFMEGGFAHFDEQKLR